MQNESVIVEEEPVEVEQQDVRVEDKASSSKKVTFKEPATTSTPAPFPQRLFPPTKDRYQAEIREIFQRCQINIPLLDAINQIPTYAKFLKELCTVKRRLNVKKKAFLTEQVSSIVQRNTPTKFRDPGSPTIACTIGTRHIPQALLDLGSSVNILPFPVYQTLGLGELKATPVILQLADRSLKTPTWLYRRCACPS